MGLDKYYTSFEVAKECINLIPEIEQYDLIVEPSAGAGSFSKQIKNCLAYDIEPEDNSIIKQDWFLVKELKGDKILVIGNPPFGIRSSLAKKFIKQAQKLNAETIAFILPDTFSKITNQTKTLFPENWRLILEHKLSNCFFDYEGKEYKVPCSFYIWTRQPGELNLRKEKLPETTDFSFVARESPLASFSINGNSGKVKEISEITNPKAENYIQAKEKTKEELIEIFKKVNFTFYSSINGGNAWIGKQEILKAYYDYIDSQEKNH